MSSETRRVLSDIKSLLGAADKLRAERLGLMAKRLGRGETDAKEELAREIVVAVLPFIERFGPEIRASVFEQIRLAFEKYDVTARKLSNDPK